MSNTLFSKNLRKLRENKKMSQKAAAASLGISQALLSHYEKGIRECGLNFLARAAKFYGVTTDFLLGLGVSTANSINDINIDNMSNMSNINNMNNMNSNINISNQFDEDMVSYANKIKDSELKKNGVEVNTYAILYKNLLINAILYIFDQMRNTKYRDISVLSGKYLSLAIYRLYTLLYNNSENTDFTGLSNLSHSSLSEKTLISELKYIINLKNIKYGENSENNQDNQNTLFNRYNFENPYLNNIINANF